MVRHTTLPSVKGQITIPVEIREKYGMSKETPVTLEDQGSGVITMKIMRLMPGSDIEYREDKKGSSITFKSGIDPQTLIDAIREIDG